MAIVGVSAGGTDASLNTVVALRHGVRGLGLVHAAFGAGAIVGPLLMAVVISAFDSWRLGYAVLVALYLVVVVGFLAVDWREPGAVEGTIGAVGHVVGTSRYRAALACSVLLFFVYVGVESCAAQWAYSLFTEDRGLGTVAAGVWVGAFWAGFTLGRVLTGFLGHRFRRVRLLDGTLLLAAAGAALFWWNPANAVGGVGLVLLGLGLAAIYPTLVSLTPRRVGQGRAPRAIGYQVAAAVVGFALIPAGFGILAEASGLELLGPVLLAGVGAVAVLHRVAAGLETA
jgi:fucose permease